MNPEQFCGGRKLFGTNRHSGRNFRVAKLRFGFVGVRKVNHFDPGKLMAQSFGEPFGKGPEAGAILKKIGEASSGSI
jgi:hypothetical protein